MENITLEIVTALYRTLDTAVVCTRGSRILFANPAAVQLLGEDPAGQSASSLIPERLLRLQGGMGAATARIRGRDAVVTLSSAGLYRMYYLRFVQPPQRMPPLPVPQWTALSNCRMAAEYFGRRDAASETDRLQAGRLLKSYYQLQRWFLNVSTLSALREGTLPFQSRPTDLAAQIHGITLQLRPLAEPRGIQVLEELPEQSPPVMVDDLLLDRLLMNLLLNSLLHCERGGRVRLGLAFMEDAVTLTVHDTGPGIPPERLGSVFDSYEVRPIPGAENAGCGLPVVLGITRLHGGELLLSSTPRLGTTVIITLPFRKPEHAAFASGRPADPRRDRESLLIGLADFLEPEDFCASTE